MEKEDADKATKGARIMIHGVTPFVAPTLIFHSANEYWQLSGK
jgi:hypothetical protein